MGSATLKCDPLRPTHIYEYDMMQIKKETANMGMQS